MWKLLGALFRGRPIEVQNSSDLKDGEARSVAVGDVAAGGLRLLLCRVEGKLHALDSLCPHDGGRIASGKLIDAKYVTCPLHHYVFDPKDGRVVQGSCRKAKLFRVEESGGKATIYV